MPERHYTHEDPPPQLESFEEHLAFWKAHGERRKEEERLRAQAEIDRPRRLLEDQHSGGADPRSDPPLPGEAIALSRFLRSARDVMDLNPDYWAKPWIARQTLESAPRLDLRTFARDGHIQPGRRVCCQLDWAETGWALQYVYLVIDLCDMDGPFAELYFGRWGGQASRQRFALVARRGSRGRPRYGFHIPGHGEAEVLAYREGRFASRVVQRLVNASQLRTACNRTMEPPRLRRVEV